jgi:hypothetical protein
MKKTQNMLVCLSTMVLAQHFCTFAEAGKRHSKTVHMAEKSANKYELNAAPCF